MSTLRSTYCTRSSRCVPQACPVPTVIYCSTPALSYGS